MNTSRIAVERECRIFTRHLTGRSPTPYVISKYCEAQSLLAAPCEGCIDSWLIPFARLHRLTAGIADSYARFFAPRGELRRKLVLLLAILESAPPFFSDIDRPVPGSRPVQVLGIAGRFAAFACGLTIGVIGFLPLQLVLSGRKAGVR
jgi:hypothetical protein